MIKNLGKALELIYDNFMVCGNLACQVAGFPGFSVRDPDDAIECVFARSDVIESDLLESFPRCSRKDAWEVKELILKVYHIEEEEAY